MNNENKYKRWFRCPGTKKQKCSCMENYVKKRTLSESDRFYIKEDGVIKEINQFQKTAIRLSKEPGEIEDSQGNIKVDSNGRARVSYKIKSRRYIQFIVEKRDFLRGYGVCEVSCQNILGYSDNLLHILLTHENEGIDKIISLAKSNSNRRIPMIPIEKLKDEKCCHRKCNEILLNQCSYFENLRIEAVISKKNTKESIKTMINYSNTERKICNRFIEKVLGISHGVLKTLKKELETTDNCDQSVTTNSSRPKPHITILAPPADTLPPNLPQCLHPIFGTINAYYNQPYDGTSQKHVNDISFSTEKRFQFIDEALNRNENQNQNNQNSSHQYSIYQFTANPNIHSDRSLGQKILSPEFVYDSVNQMVFHNNLHRPVRMPNYEYTEHTIQQYKDPIGSQPQDLYQYMLVRNPNINGQQAEDPNHCNENIHPLVSNQGEFQSKPLATHENINMNPSQCATYKCLTPQDLEYIRTIQAGSLSVKTRKLLLKLLESDLDDQSHQQQ